MSALSPRNSSGHSSSAVVSTMRVVAPGPLIGGGAPRQAGGTGRGAGGGGRGREGKRGERRGGRDGGEPADGEVEEDAEPAGRVGPGQLHEDAGAGQPPDHGEQADPPGRVRHDQAERRGG